MLTTNFLLLTALTIATFGLADTRPGTSRHHPNPLLVRGDGGGLIGARQTETCDPGYQVCTDANGGCVPTGATCCTGTDNYCFAGETCTASGSCTGTADAYSSITFSFAEPTGSSGGYGVSSSSQSIAKQSGARERAVGAGVVGVVVVAAVAATELF